MLSYIGQNVLITTSGWFMAPDGLEYRGVFGKLKGVHEAGKSLGFIPNRSHANWFIEIGNMVIMGCQVMYVVRTDNPVLSQVDDWQMNEGKVIQFNRPTRIYKAEDK